MNESPRPDFSLIVRDNEHAAASALERGDFLSALLLVHTLIEALLRLFLNRHGHHEKFSDLVGALARDLKQQGVPEPPFLNELRGLNKHRNDAVHGLWRRGYSDTNRTVATSARAALLLYGLVIEWLETVDPDITSVGFRYDDGA